MCELNCRVLKAPKFEKVEIRNHSKRNVKQFIEFLSQSNYQDLLACEDVEAVTSALTEYVEDAYYSHFPKKTINRHEKFIHKPSDELLSAIDSTKRSYGKFKNVRKNGMKVNAISVGHATIV